MAPPEPTAASGADVIVDFVNGYCLALAAPIGRSIDAREAMSTELAARPAHTTGTQRRLAHDPAVAQRDSFTFGLDVILTGLEALLTPEPPRSAPGKRPLTVD